jgi:predicted nucleotidyltransferase component of viral defense system
MPPDYIVEKDLYVSYVLDFLFNRSEIKDNIEFRGGTILSKGYNLINRFSEDIDIVYKNENFEKKIQYILDNKDESGKPFSKTKRKNLLRIYEKNPKIIVKIQFSQL